ncbi:MAG: glycoside hydrolase family 5 protein [Fibrobacter sp.]|nr:glycoside hydrolase family 5 protein [Fibrobacter sp.]
MIINRTETRHFRCGLLVILLSFFASQSDASYLHAKGSKLYNDKGQVVQLTGVNWFGFETSNLGPHGLWARDYHGMLRQVKSMGFNCIRIPFCNSMLRDGAKVRSINFYGEDPYYQRDKNLMNCELAGLTPIQIMDEIISYAGKLGLAVILDNHSREPDGYMEERLWYTKVTSEQQWIDDWVMLAKRYNNNHAVIGFDLNNEPHGKIKDGGASWGTGNTLSDWNTAAQKCGNAILAVNSNVLIIIEGVEQVGSTSYWWGGNLRGVATHPIVLSKKEKLVYSPHEYGPEVFQQPWFDDSAFPDNMEAIWDQSFGFISRLNIAPLFIGEFGINDMKSYNNKAGIWFTRFLKYMADHSLSWTFWSLNPNSGDTGGMLKYDWVSIEQWKLDALKPWLAPEVIEPAAVQKRQPRSISKGKHLKIADGIITLSEIPSGKIKMRVATISGKVIFSSSIQPLNIKKLPKGIYTAAVYQNDVLIESLTFAAD